jgi:fluoroquinolone resistance protein
MERSIVEGREFEKMDFRDTPVPFGEFESCTFNQCDFSNADISGLFFLDCHFLGCNLSMAGLAKTTFRDVQFSDCKMLGMRFDSCSQFGFAVKFEKCILNHSSFYQTKLKKTVFRNISLHEVDFAGADLTQAVFDNCDFAGATFDNTNIEKADFLTSINYSINPEINKIKKAKFSLHGLPGLLDRYDIDISYD